MNHDLRDQHAIAASIMQSTGADGYFSLVVEATLRKLRVTMAAPAPGVDGVVDGEFDMMREQFGKFYLEYQQGYSSLLLEHLDSRLLSEAASALGSDAALAYFRAVRAMDSPLRALFEELGSRMLQHARYRSGARADL